MKASLLLEYYKKELQDLEVLGKEFSALYPEVAETLSLGESQMDPSASLLIESVAFLTSRINYKIDAAYPRFSQQLLEYMFPQLGEPLPSSAMFQFSPGKVPRGHEHNIELPQGVQVRSAEKNNAPSCTFTLDTLTPLSAAEIVNVSTSDKLPPDVEGLAKGFGERVNSVVDVHVDNPHGPVSLNETLMLYVNLSDAETSSFLQQFAGNEDSVVIIESHGQSHVLNHEDVQLLALDGKSGDASDADIQYFSLALSYFQFPARFHLLVLDLSSTAIDRNASICVRFASLKPWIQSQNHYSQNSFKLNCGVASNRFSKRLDRINLESERCFYPLFADRSQPHAYEILSVTSVTGYGYGNERLCEFKPIGVLKKNGDLLYETERTRPFSSAGERAQATQMEIKLSKDTFEQRAIKQIGMHAVCSNGVMPEQLATGKAVDWQVDSDINFTHVSTVSGPCRPYYPPVGEAAFWQLISNLSIQLSYLLTDDSKASAERLKRFLSVFIQKDNLRHRQLCESIVGIEHHEMTKKLIIDGLPSMARGLSVNVQLNDEAFPHGESWLFGAMLSRFLAYLLPVNCFLKFSLTSRMEGEVGNWPIRTGQGRLL